jgi:hypothetical protein
MIFSESMNNCIKLGYKFEILWGYTFDQGIIFNYYINDLYSLRLEYEKSHPMNFIAKLLINSLYGSSLRLAPAAKAAGLLQKLRQHCWSGNHALDYWSSG